MSSDTSKQTSYTKRKARQAAKAYRNQLSEDKLASLSQKICENALAYVADAHSDDLYIHVYQPINRLKEIDSTPLIKGVKKRHSVTIQSHAPFFPDEVFDIIFIPGLAFDKRGNRVGYGSGAYDRFLAHQPRATRVGLQFEALVFNTIESEDHDQKLEVIITENQIHKL